MMLDNGFILRNKKLNTHLALFTFHNYMELAQFFRKTQQPIDTDKEEYAVTPDILLALKSNLVPIYDELSCLPLNTVSYYDYEGYPQKYLELFFGMDFNPTRSGSSFSGTKLMTLYHRIDALLDIMKRLDKDEYEIVFYDLES